MALPDYEASVQPEGLPGRPFPRLPDEVSPAGGMAIGRGIEDAGNVVQQQYDRSQAQMLAAQEATQRQAQQSQLGDAHNQGQAVAIDLLSNPQTGALTKQGKDAFGIGPQYLSQFDQRADQIVANVPDPRARQAAAVAMQEIRGHLSEQLDTHELDQHQKFADQTDNATISLAQQQLALNYNHPDVIAAQFDHMDAALENMAARKGWSPEQLEEAKAQQHNSAHSDVIDRMLTDGKIPLAQQYFDVTKGELSPTTAYALSGRIQEAIHKNDADLRETVSRQLQDTSAAALRGLPIPPSSMPSRSAVLAAFPKDGAERYDSLQSDIRMGTDLKAMAGMTPEQIAQRVSQYSVTSGGPGTAEALKRSDYMQNVAKQITAARNADPRQYLIDNQLGSSPLNFNQQPDAFLADLRGRAASTADNTQQMGVPVPLLTKDEAKQASQWLGTATPANAVAMLAQLRQALPGGAFDSVREQIIPHQPIIGVAASLIPAPPSANTPSWYDAHFAADPEAAEGIIDGERILAGGDRGKDNERAVIKGGFVMPKDEDGSKPGLATFFRNESSSAYTGNAFQGRPETAQYYYGAFKAYYAHLAAEKGLTTGVVDADLARQAAHGVLGDITHFNHSDVSVPRGMDPTSFQGIAEQGIREAAKRAGYSDDDAAIIQGMDLRELGGSVGSGRYAVIDGNGRAWPTKDGKSSLVIDLRDVKRPPWVAGEAPLSAFELEGGDQ